MGLDIEEVNLAFGAEQHAPGHAAVAAGRCEMQNCFAPRQTADGWFMPGRLIPYLFISSAAWLLLCSHTRRISSSVTPTYNVPLRLLARMKMQGLFTPPIYPQRGRHGFPLSRE